MSDTVNKLLNDQLVKLKADNEYLSRQIPFLAQRLEDMKKTMQSNTEAIVDIESALGIRWS
jgi:uncharacterized coiled-coil protein SlyX